MTAKAGKTSKKLEISLPSIIKAFSNNLGCYIHWFPLKSEVIKNDIFYASFWYILYIKISRGCNFVCFFVNLFFIETTMFNSKILYFLLPFPSNKVSLIQPHLIFANVFAIEGLSAGDLWSKLTSHGTLETATQSCS